MSPANEHIRQLILMVMRQQFTEDVVIAVPQGVAVLDTDGRHTLIRIDDAYLEVAR